MILCMKDLGERQCPSPIAKYTILISAMAVGMAMAFKN